MMDVMTGCSKDRRLFLARVGAAAAASFVVNPLFAQAKPGMRSNIANASGAGNLTLQQLMKDQGFLEEFGIEPNVVSVGDGSKIVSVLLGGDMDSSTMSGFTQVFPAIERGGKLKVLAGAMLLPALALFTSKPNVQTLKDLQGKNVGSGSPGALVHQLTVALLRAKGVDYRKVNFINIGSSVDVFRAVTVGMIDAGLGDATHLDEQQRYKVHAISGGNLSVELPAYTYQGAYASDRVIETKRDLLVRTLAAYGKLYRFIHKPEAKEAFIKARIAALKTTSSEENESMWRYVQTYKPYAVNLALNEERLRYMQELNVELGIQKKILPFAQIADMSIARDAVKLLGGEI
jgi:ABC-type nitrate/sulfonate/bicarbonate transport system substrate-binding protein